MNTFAKSPISARIIKNSIKIGSSMKFILVTSEVTFVPENYNLFLQSLFYNLSDDCSQIDALVVLQNNSIKLVLQGIVLMIIGARKIGFNLIKNSIRARSRDHENIASSFGIKTLYFKNPNDPKFIEYVKENKIDMIINARTRYIYKKKILKAPSLGCINIHHGILPNHRGTMSDLYALYENRPAGFTIHKMETKIDSGDIIRVKEVTFPNLENQYSMDFSLHTKESSRVEGLEISKIIKVIIDCGRIPIDSQNTSSNATYTKNPGFILIRKMIRKGLIL